MEQIRYAVFVAVLVAFQHVDFKIIHKIKANVIRLKEKMNQDLNRKKNKKRLIGPTNSSPFRHYYPPFSHSLNFAQKKLLGYIKRKIVYY